MSIVQHLSDVPSAKRLGATYMQISSGQAGKELIQLGAYRVSRLPILPKIAHHLKQLRMTSQEHPDSSLMTIINHLLTILTLVMKQGWWNVADAVVPTSNEMLAGTNTKGKRTNDAMTMTKTTGSNKTVCFAEPMATLAATMAPKSIAIRRGLTRELRGLQPMQSTAKASTVIIDNTVNLCIKNPSCNQLENGKGVVHLGFDQSPELLCFTNLDLGKPQSLYNALNGPDGKLP